LQGANLSQARLRGAILSHANLSAANLSAAKLQGARLLEADLLGTDLLGAALQNADLSKTKGATQEQIEQAVGDDETIVPEGLRTPSAWTPSTNEHPGESE
jgi:uncharacterized protein YjbI with pentapeptide repeats